jgi:hypothetical protein
MSVVALAVPAQAQISKLDLTMTRPPAGRNSTAFDTVNKVYLVVEAGSPLTGRFLNESGTPVTSAFAITSGTEASFTGWASITFGGTSSDPAFLVTYVAAEGSGAHTKYARLVRYAGGSPSISARSGIVAVGPEWFAAEKAQATWFGDKFIVGTRAPGGFIAEAVVHQVDLNGNVVAGQSLGDGQDYYGSPAIACASNGVCLATGYAGGIPLGDPNSNASFARLFSAQTLQPLSNIVYLDGLGGRLEEQGVVYNSKIGRFLTGWWKAGTVQTRLMSTDGTLDPAKTAVPDFAGDLAFSFNSGTQTTLLVTKRFPADLYVLELSDAGLPVNMNNLLLVTTWDGAWPEYIPAAAVNAAKGQWLVTAVQTNGGRGILVTGNGAAGGGSAPPTPCSYNLSTAGGTFGPLGGSGGFTVSTDPTCPWNASSSAPWLVLGAGSASGSGTKVISYSVEPNPTFANRAATITISGTTYSVSQGAGTAPMSLPQRARSDFDGDGGYDILWQHTDGTLAYWSLNLNAVKGIGLLSNGIEPNSPWRIAGTGDFNADSKPDILWQNTSTGFVVVWLMNGTTLAGVMPLSIPQVPDTSWRIAAVADFNHDATADILWQHGSGSLAVWLMNGVNVMGIMTPSPSSVADPAWKVAGAADFNGDGNVDIIWRHTDGSIVAWVMSGLDLSSILWFDPPNLDANWKLVAIADANGDGKPDIVWQHSAGWVALWCLSDNHLTQTMLMEPSGVSDAAWKIVGPK